MKPTHKFDVAMMVVITIVVIFMAACILSLAGAQ